MDNAKAPKIKTWTFQLTLSVEGETRERALLHAFDRINDEDYDWTNFTLEEETDVD
jgi:hypothetical protein